MGLDLVVEGCPKPGYEAEWRRILERAFAEEPQEADQERFADISIPGYERVGAPRVGFDPAADAWLIENGKAETPEQRARMMKEMHGYHVLALARCDGVPRYTHGGLYDGVDETSFRGAFLKGCGDILSQEEIDQAWDHKFPEEAVRYGRALLAAAAAPAVAQAPPPQAKPGLLGRLFGTKKPPPEALPLEEQRAIVEAAGRWFVFWGERGHAIRAWF